MAKDDDGRAKLYADIAHPINSPCREMIQHRVIQAFEEEKARSKLPGYVSSYDDFEAEGARGVVSAADCGSNDAQIQKAERPHGPQSPLAKEPTRPSPKRWLRGGYFRFSWTCAIFSPLPPGGREAGGEGGASPRSSPPTLSQVRGM